MGERISSNTPELEILKDLTSGNQYLVEEEITLEPS